MSGIAQSSAIGETVRLSPAYVQPNPSSDVADAVTDVALVAPVNGTIEIAGPERVRLNELIARFLSATKDPRKVIVDKHAPYFGVELDNQSRFAGDNPRIGSSRLEDWFGRSAPRK
jgi:uncharacterized protein YbjT (DUF2867 family)